MEIDHTSVILNLHNNNLYSFVTHTLPIFDRYIQSVELYHVNGPTVMDYKMSTVYKLEFMFFWKGVFCFYISLGLVQSKYYVFHCNYTSCH